MKLPVALCLSIALAATTLAAQPTASLKGTVQNQHGQPVAGATVHLAGVGQPRVRTVLTDAAGSYSDASLPPARYFVVVTAPGHNRYDKFALELGEGDELVHDIVLEKATPEGFTNLFNGEDLAGWHVSKTCFHGNDPDIRVIGGVIVATQNPFLRGGVLLTNKKYRNFEVTVDIWPDLGCDGGLFLRSSEAGQAYQVTIDYLKGGGRIAGLYGEGLRGMQGPRGDNGWRKVWKPEDWNNLRARITGGVPHIQVWLNGTQLIDWKDTENRSIGGAVDGYIGLQVHGLERWKDGGFHRFRNIAVKELPAKEAAAE